MIKQVKQWAFAAFFAIAVGGTFATAITPGTASAACSSGFLTFPAWYNGLVDGSCNIQSPDKVTGGLKGFIFKIISNIIEIALQVVAYISVGFIIYGGFLYMIGAGTADKMVSARKTILNAIIGLVLSFFSIVIVNVIASRIN